MLTASSQNCSSVCRQLGEYENRQQIRSTK